MANKRLQCRQLFWRNGWSTASERAGELRLDSAAPAVAQQGRPARSCRSSGRSRGSGLIPGPHPTLEVRFNATRLQSNLASPEVVPDSLRSAHARRRRSVPAVRQVLQRSRAEDSRAANFNAHPDVVPARDSAASRRAWRSNRHRPAPPSPRAPDEPSAALEWSLDGTPASVRRRRPHRPAQPAVPSREGTPARHDQYRRPARNPPSVDGPSLRLVCFLRRWSLNRSGFNFRQFSRLVDTLMDQPYPVARR